MSQGLTIRRGETGLGTASQESSCGRVRRIKVELGVGSETGPAAPSARLGKL